MSAQRKEEDQYRKLVLVQEFFMSHGRNSPMTERIKWIRQQGSNLGTSSGDPGDQINRDILERLTDGLKPNERQQVLATVVDVEWQRIKDKPQNTRNTFLRSNSIFKLASELNLREQIEKNPGMVDEFLQDSIQFLANDSVDPHLMKIYHDVINKADNKATAVHNMNFLRAGAILNYCQEQSKNPNLTEQERAQWKEKHMQAMKEANFKLTDVNKVLTTDWENPQKDQSQVFRSMTDGRETRNNHVVTNDEIERYTKVLDEKLHSIDSKAYPKGTITNDRQYVERTGIFRDKRNKWAQNKEQQRLDSRSGFQKFVDGIKSMWNSVFGNEPDQVVIKVETDRKSVNDPELIHQEEQEDISNELDEKGYKQEVEETMGKDIDPNNVVDIKIESRHEDIKQQVQKGQEAMRDAKSARPQTPGQTPGKEDVHSILDQAQKARPETPKGLETPGKD